MIEAASSLVRESRVRFLSQPEEDLSQLEQSWKLQSVQF